MPKLNRKKPLIILLALSLVVFLLQKKPIKQTKAAGQVLQASTACDHHVYLGATKVFGNNLGGKVVQPGERVCVHAGTYKEGKLEFLNFVGQAGKPITITNIDGQVIVKSTLYLTSSRYVVINGSGTKSVTYGFKVIGPQQGPGLSCGQYKTSSGSKGVEISNIEIHHVEILFDTNHGNAGVGASNDNGSGPLENLSLHDIYIHRTKQSPIETSGTYTEGFYIGSSFYESENVATLKGVKIYNNIVEDAGWDGIQVGSASGGDCKIFNNTVIRDSREYLKWQHSGIRVNPGSQCDVYNNKILESHGPGIYYYHSNGGHVYNNLIVLADQIEIDPTLSWHLPPARYPITPDYGETRRGIFVDSARDIKTGTKYDVFVYNNTISEDKICGIRMDNTDRIRDYKIFNNLIVNSENGISGADLAKVFNNYIGSHSNIYFTNFTNKDFHLTSQSTVAIDKGIWDSVSRAQADLDGKQRINPPDLGAYEYTGGVQPTATSTPSSAPTPPLSPTPSPNPYDLDGNGYVNAADVLILLDNWRNGSQGDFNSDGKVNSLDFGLLMANWGI